MYKKIKMLPDPNYIQHQKEVTWSARTILVNWIAEVHWKFKMQPETLFLTVNLIDRFLSIKTIKLNKFQLLALCALLISAKYMETVVPSIKDLVRIVNHMYTREEIIQAERCVLVLLGFDLGYPDPLHFLRRISKADGYGTRTKILANYLIEIALLDEHFLSYPPSVVAGAAVLLARKILFNDHDWVSFFFLLFFFFFFIFFFFFFFFFFFLFYIYFYFILLFIILIILSYKIYNNNINK